ncbi:MAG TPA: ABC transporter ATP-binding protein [Solirubrobacteraceae bacterium]|nr:ABC transporter ATP-binding protein [Solirubrobacteraceae bacterium]
MSPERHVLEFERVVKHYHSADALSDGGEEVRAVDGVSLVVRAGEMVALHGPSGSGKTTLLKLAATLLAPERGTIRFEGVDLSSFTEAQSSAYLLRDVGFIHQSPHLMGRVSALENASIKLLLGGVPRREARERARQWLERLGLAARTRRTPEQLSGGERQRVAIARALAGDPRLILADEPTGNLDSARSREVVALLAQIAHERRCGVLLVTHDTEAARLADRGLTLCDGELHEHTPGPRASEHALGGEPHEQPPDPESPASPTLARALPTG